MRHAARCGEFVINSTAENKGREWALHNLGDMFSKVGRLDEAKTMYQRALQGYEKALGPNHTSTLNTVNDLGLLYADLGRLEEAKKMYQRALQGYEKAMGHEAVKTYIPALNTLENLAALCA